MPSGYKHGDTPKRAMVRGTISYLESQGLPVNKSAIFRHFGLSRSQGYASLSIPASKRNDPEWEETRGRPSKISDLDQAAMEAVLWDERYEGMNLNWAGLAREAGVETECNARTLHRTMGTLGYRRCLSLPGVVGALTGGGVDGSTVGCSRSWVHKKARERRVEYAERMLEAYPEPHNWRFVRFSGELHFGFGLDGKVRLMPKPGEKFCETCRQQQEQNQPQQQQQQQQQQKPDGEEGVPADEASSPPATGGSSGGWQRDVKRLHAWAAIGYGFKSELIFYDDSTSPNNNGVMAMQDYRDKILEPVIKPWLDPNMTTTTTNPDGTTVVLGPQPFVLEEDVEAFAHGGASKVNMVQQWKEAHGLRCYFNCLDSPDLSPLDSLWPPGKQWTIVGNGEDSTTPQALPDWEPETLKQAARDAWQLVDQERVNVWVDFMPERLRQVVSSEGRMVPW